MVVNLNKPEEDIDVEIKKMDFIDYLTNTRKSAEEMVSKFGFSFVKTFVLKIVNISENHSARSMTKRANIILNELKLLKPIEDYPEAWI